MAMVINIEEKTRKEIFDGLEQLRKPQRDVYVFSPLMDEVLLQARQIKEGKDPIRWNDLIRFWVQQKWPLVSACTLRKRLRFLQGAQT